METNTSSEEEIHPFFGILLENWENRCPLHLVKAGNNFLKSYMQSLQKSIDLDQSQNWPPVTMQEATWLIDSLKVNKAPVVNYVMPKLNKRNSNWLSSLFTFKDQTSLYSKSDGYNCPNLFKKGKKNEPWRPISLLQGFSSKLYAKHLIFKLQDWIETIGAIQNE